MAILLQEKNPPRAVSRSPLRWIVFFALLAGHLGLALANGAPTTDRGQIGISQPADRVVLSGGVPLDYFPDIQHRTDTIWSDLVRRLGLTGKPAAPVIHFSTFDRTAQSPEWTAWQKSWTRNHPVIWRDWTALRSKNGRGEISQQWIEDNIEEIFPFPKTFLAFHYDGTNRIQINPGRTFLSSVQNDPYGVRHDLDGRGYYTMAHEMLHYALELKGMVPTKLHHCLMLYQPPEEKTPALLEQVTEYLVKRKMLASIARRRGLYVERSFAPCATLTEEETHRVEQFRAMLSALPTAD